MEAAVCCTLKNYCVYMGHIFANSVDPPTHQNLFVSHVQNTQSGILNSRSINFLPHLTGVSRVETTRVIFSMSLKSSR